MNFRSHQPLHHKPGVVCSLLDRKDSIITTEENIAHEDSHMSEALRKNNYPNWSIKLARQTKENKSSKPTNTGDKKIDETLKEQRNNDHHSLCARNK